MLGVVLCSLIIDAMKEPLSTLRHVLDKSVAERAPELPQFWVEGVREIVHHSLQLSSHPPQHTAAKNRTLATTDW